MESVPGPIIIITIRVNSIKYNKMQVMQHKTMHNINVMLHVI